MRPTRRVRWVAAAAGGWVLVAAVTLRITPALVGLAGVVFLAHSRFAARSAFEASDVRVERDVRAEGVYRGEPVEVVLDAEASRLAPGVGLVVEDEVPGVVEVRGEARVVGAARRSFSVVPLETGSVRFERVRVELVDARGLWVHEERVPLVLEVRVLPSQERLAAGRRLARRTPLEARVRDQAGLVVKELEFESVRSFEPGDRLRDVDWKQFSKLEELVTREFERAQEAPVVFLVDAGRTMRQAQRGGDSKLDFVGEVVVELAESANARGHPVGCVAFDDRRVVESVEPSRARGVPRRLAGLVSELPERVRAARRLDVGLSGASSVDEGEVAFLERLGALSGASSGSSSGVVGLDRAMGRLVGQAGPDRVFVIALTDLEGFPDEGVRALSRLASRGHWVLTGVVPGSWFLDPPERVRARDLENAYKEIETRRRVRRRLEARDVGVVEVGPWTPSARIVEATSEMTGEASSRRGRGVSSEGGSS